MREEKVGESNNTHIYWVVGSKKNKIYKTTKSCVYSDCHCHSHDKWTNFYLHLFLFVRQQKSPILPPIRKINRTFKGFLVVATDRHISFCFLWGWDSIESRVYSHESLNSTNTTVSPGWTPLSPPCTQHKKQIINLTNFPVSMRLCRREKRMLVNQIIHVYIELLVPKQ